MSMTSSVGKSGPTAEADNTEVDTEERPVSGGNGDKLSSVEKKQSVSISEGDSSNVKATTTDSDMEDCQDASGSSSEDYSGVAGRAGANPPVADSSTSTDTVGGTEVDNSAGSERGESTTVSCRVCH